jgi:hypothetical protein
MNTYRPDIVPIDERVPIYIIIQRVCELLNVDRRDVLSQSRKDQLVEARVIISMIALDMNYGPSVIGSHMNKNHATIIHYKNNGIIKRWFTNYNGIRSKYYECKSRTINADLSEYEIISTLEKMEELSRRVSKIKQHLKKSGRLTAALKFRINGFRVHILGNINTNESNIERIKEVI